MKSSMIIYLFYFSVIVVVLLVWDQHTHWSLVTTIQGVVFPSFQEIKHVLSVPFRVMKATDSRKNVGPDSFSLHCSRNPVPIALVSGKLSGKF